MHRNAIKKQSGRGIYSIDPDDEEFKDILKNARRKLEIPMRRSICDWEYELFTTHVR